jgi:hypothetical protein
MTEELKEMNLRAQALKVQEADRISKSVPIKGFIDK